MSLKRFLRTWSRRWREGLRPGPAARWLLALAWIAGGTVIASWGQAPSGERPRLRSADDVTVTFLLLDTVVTDRKGVPIRDLAREEFELLIDNELTELASVEKHCGTSDVPGGPAIQDRHYILFFDMSHLKAGARRKSIQIATEFVERRLAAPDRAMVLAFSRGLHLVSGFTSDRSFLLDRLEKMEQDRALLDTSPFEQENDLLRLSRERSRALGDLGARGRSGMRGMSVPSAFANPECIAQARMAEIETTRALRAISNSMPAFAALPGRKSLMLFSETLQADPSLAYYRACGVSWRDSPSLGLTVVPEIQDLAHRANLAGVSFYPMHAGGMASGFSGRVMEQSLAFQKSISLSTGGEAFVVMKKPLAAFDQAARDLSCYYMLGSRVGEEMEYGRHSVKVRVSRKKVRVRHRESFVLQTAEEASEQEMLAVLSNPGLYRDLAVTARGYTLADASRRARHFLIQASVPLAELVFLPSSPSGLSGRVHIRGGVIGRGELACEFSGTHSIPGAGGTGGAAGVQTTCKLPDGEYELVVAGRDEQGGALGTFWGRFEVGTDEGAGTSGALLWAPSDEGSWSRLGEEPWLPALGGSGVPLFVRHSLRLRAEEAGVVTFTACRGPGKTESAQVALAEAMLTLRGRSTVTFPATAAKKRPDGRCELLRTEIHPAALPPGDYEVIPQVGTPWTIAGKPVRLRID